ncbi:ABC transporter substrate binding protein [Brachyspira sp.]|uniref:ABC transporter substrate-binding protein n=1 Tax=Brachyspira sp. TaxID=1977261 RepID=UPI00261AF25A|nr:ABC transporter substrate binding protein [Brachyspira sp.]
MILNRLFLLLSILFIISCNNNEENLDKPTIISIIKEENSRNYNAIEKGLLDQVNLDKLNIKINFYTLDGNESTTIQIANNVRDDNSTIAIVIGENVTLVSMNVIVPQSIIFAGFFDNLSISNIYKSKIQNNNITGVYGNLDITKYIKKISNKEINSFAYLYTRASTVSGHISEHIAQYCHNENIKYYPLEIIGENYNSYDIENMIKSKNIDYLFLANEDYIDNNIYSIAYLCEKYSIPIINTDIIDAINVGILFSLDFNYYYLGRQLALMLDKIIKNNSKTEDIDFIEVSNSYRIFVNEDIGNHYNIKFSDEILEISSLILKGGNIIRK